MVTKLGPSLLHQKQAQWAKEREELHKLGGLWGPIWNTQEKLYKPSIRSQYQSNLELATHQEAEVPTEQLAKKTNTKSTTNQLFQCRGKQNRNTNKKTGKRPQQAQDEDGSGTSGYASDSAGNDYNLAETWTKPTTSWPQFPRRTPESASSGSERAKWGDRGVGVGHLWEPSALLPPPPLPRMHPSTPLWIHRGLKDPPQVLVISHGSEQDGMSTTASSSGETVRSIETPASSVELNRTYVRGQNVPLDAAEMQERDRKRLRALEHQNAIKKQLEEKEKKKREEQERLEREEKAAEERFKKQQELERQRLEEEQRRIKEKEEKEERIARAMREALEFAKKTAQEEKAKSRRKHIKREINSTPQPEIREKSSSIPPEPSVQRPNQPTPKPAPAKTTLQVPITPMAALTKERKTPSRPDIDPQQEEQERQEDQNVAETRNLEMGLERLEIEATQLRVVPPPGRTLTPSMYRSNRGVERSTQTEQKTKTQKRYLRLEERPKWGVNRPEVRYIKASDRDPYRRARVSTRDSSSRSPSPLNDSKMSFTSMTSLNRSNAKSTLKGALSRGRVTRGVGTPRVMQVLSPGGIVRKTSAGKRIIPNKGLIGVGQPKRPNRPQQSNMNFLKKLEAAEFLSVNQVLTQLMDLKKGLQMKQKEWELTRSPTPFSEVSFKT